MLDYESTHSTPGMKYFSFSMAISWASSDSKNFAKAENHLNYFEPKLGRTGQLPYLSQKKESLKRIENLASFL